ncbi:hypothetical protein AVDCRST_MAG92-5156 [uncultured Coleofasciculus sp.]|uniref:Uncharacterized protein n=1 Tax=uncultured Coleofasciculus sp. TaxID=1267456 RepID=A0A6J4KCE3_9CYAN|nr:hypothetical protein AVDCRST_MAG92-5156 [uncultured Coleofasciculus sp.]
MNSESGSSFLSAASVGFSSFLLGQFNICRWESWEIMGNVSLKAN